FELHNLMDGPLYVESVKLDPSVAYKLVDHSTHNTGPSYHHPMLKGESRRFLYELEPKNHRQSIKGVTALGKIALSWKGIMGESGTLVTNTIRYEGIVKQEIEAIVSGIQEKIIAGKSVELILTVFNRSPKNVNLVLSFNHERMFPIGMNGQSIQVNLFGVF